jgi:hypothetical protein
MRKSMDQCGIGPGACATGGPSLGAAARSDDLTELFIVCRVYVASLVAGDQRITYPLLDGLLVTRRARPAGRDP